MLSLGKHLGFGSQITSHVYNKLHLIQVNKIMCIYILHNCRQFKKCLCYTFIIFSQNTFVSVSSESKYVNIKNIFLLLFIIIYSREEHGVSLFSFLRRKTVDNYVPAMNAESASVDADFTVGKITCSSLLP